MRLLSIALMGLLLPLIIFVPYYQPVAFPPIHGRHQGAVEYVNPYLYYSSPPAPGGIASFGLYNYSGKVTPYIILTNRVTGYVNVSNLLAYYKQAKRYGVNPYSATLQMNVVLQVNTTYGTFAYWLQDVGSYQTSNHQLTFIDNIWNLTGNPSVLSSSSVSGNGKVASAGGGNTFYYDVGPSYTYSFPLVYLYVVNVSYNSNYLYVWFGYSFGGNTQYYDKVSIKQGGIVSAAIAIDGYTYTPDGLYYDAELVWGGGGNGAPTQFVNLNATLGLYEGNTLQPIPSLYTFGSDTGESAYNVHDVLVNGVPTVYAGVEELKLLTNNFTVIL